MVTDGSVVELVACEEAAAAEDELAPDAVADGDETDAPGVLVANLVPFWW